VNVAARLSRSGQSRRTSTEVSACAVPERESVVLVVFIVVEIVVLVLVVIKIVVVEVVVVAVLVVEILVVIKIVVVEIVVVEIVEVVLTLVVLVLLAEEEGCGLAVDGAQRIVVDLEGVCEDVIRVVNLWVVVTGPGDDGVVVGLQRCYESIKCGSRVDGHGLTVALVGPK
jgi:hypothetical protein